MGLKDLGLYATVDTVLWLIRKALAGLTTFTSSLAGIVPASGGGTTNFLRADGTWAPPPGTGTSEAFPVGSIFITVVDTDPATLLGYGVWEPFGTGRVLVGLDEAQANLDTVGETN